MKINNILKSAFAAVCITAAASSHSYAQAKKIAIANFGEHPQLNQVVEGFKNEILASGMVEGKDVEFTLDHVNFDASLLPQMISKIQATKPDLILAVTTPVAQNMKNQLGESGIPIVFGAVTDPVSAGLVPDWEHGGKYISGASDAYDIDATLKFARMLFPDAQNFGVPYNPGEANDVATLELFKDHGESNGFNIIEVGIDNVNEIQTRTTALAGKADVIYGPASNLIQPAIAAAASAANEAGIPIINTNSELVEEGVIAAAFTVSYEKIGEIAGSIGLKALAGESLVNVAPQTPKFEDHVAVISRKAMESLGKEIPASLEDCGCIVD